MSGQGHKGSTWWPVLPKRLRGRTDAQIDAKAAIAATDAKREAARSRADAVAFVAKGGRR